MDAEIKIVNNELDNKPIYELMKIHSSEADLVFVGIPEIEEGKGGSFVENTNNLVHTIGTTLLVKASSQFEETDLKIEHIDIKAESEKIDEAYVIPLNDCEDASFNEVAQKFDIQLNKIVHELTEHSVERIENYHHRIFSQVIDIMDIFLDDVSADDDMQQLHEKLHRTLQQVEMVLMDAVENQLPIVSEEFDKDINLYIKHKEEFINHLPGSIQIQTVYDENKELKPAKRRVKFRTAVQRIWFSEGMLESYDQFLEFGYQNLILLHQSKNLLHTVIWDFLLVIRKKDEIVVKVKELKKKLDVALAEIDEDALNLSANFYKRIRNKERENLNQLNDIILEKKYMNVLAEKYPPTGPSVIKSVRKELQAFPAYWNRNIKVFTQHLIGDVQLMKFSASLQAFSDEAVDYTEQNYLSILSTNIVQLNEGIAALEKAVAKGNEKEIVNTDIQLADEIFLNSELVVGRLVDSIDKALQDVPDVVELMTAESINEIRNNQSKDVQTDKVGLRDITEFLVKREFEDPIHEQVQLFYEQLKRAIGKLINGSNLIQSGLDNYATSEKLDNLKSSIENAKIEISESEIQIETAQQAFETELRDRREGLKKELDINQIIEQIESLSQYVKQHKRRSGIKEVVQSLNKVVGAKIRAGLNYFVQKQQDISSTAYKRKYGAAESEQGVIADFLDAVSPKAELPFYYQQLYTATAFSEGGIVENRKAEIELIRTAIRRIDMGAAGGILILGSAGSGKTFLTSHVANYILKGKTYNVHPPINKTRKKEDLIKALKRATGFKDTVNGIMSSIPPHSTFVFQDLERWWMKSKDGSVLLDELAKLISEYGAQHYFLMNANIHSFELMSAQSFINSAISRSVILAPLTTAQVREAIWSRHKSGGLIAHINGESERHLSVNKVNKFLNRYHNTSGGVIGLALSQWLASIQEKKDNDLIVSSPRSVEFPAITRVELKNLIFQLYIHHSLTKNELYKLYGKENKNWIDRTTNALVLSGMVKLNEREALYIDSVAKPYVENWLNEYGFIK